MCVCPPLTTSLTGNSLTHFTQIVIKCLVGTPATKAKIEKARFLLLPGLLEVAHRWLKQSLNREIAAWRDLKHPNVAELLGIAYMDPNLPPGLVSRYVLRHDFLGYIGRHPERKRRKVCTICF
jgi:hypothetical protein